MVKKVTGETRRECPEWLAILSNKVVPPFLFLGISLLCLYFTDKVDALTKISLYATSTATGYTFVWWTVSI